MKYHPSRSIVGLLFTAVLLSAGICAFAVSNNPSPIPVQDTAPNKIPTAPAYVKGVVLDTQFSRELSATSRNSSHLIFWVKNNGEADIVFDANGQQTKTLSPGQQDQIAQPLYSYLPILPLPSSPHLSRRLHLYPISHYPQQPLTG